MATSKPNRSDGSKRCFVVSAFGSSEPERREHTQVLKHLVRKVLEPMGYKVERADEIDEAGQITHQVIERLLDDELVIADLTNRNPNVFYELAVRHAARKPVVTLMVEGQELPFDLKDVRTVFYDIHDPDKLESAQEDLSQKVIAIEASGEPVRNPITVARNVTLLRESDDPDVQAAGAVLSAISDIREEMRELRRFVARPRPRVAPAAVARQRIKRLLASGGTYTTNEVAKACDAPLGWVESTLGAMAEAKQIYAVDGGWSEIPF
jgi:hypothetical protein